MRTVRSQHQVSMFTAALLTLAAVHAPRVDAQAPSSASAPISKIAYRVTIQPALLSKRTIHVTMSFEVGGPDPVLLAMPAWTPGAYELSYFARWVTNFAATSDGKPLDWDKQDYQTWRVRTAGAKAVTVAFDYVADTLDNAMAWSKPNFVLFNGTNLFLYPAGRGFDSPATVRVDAPADWRVVTGMASGDAPRAFSAPNYHDLVDMPFFVGRFDLDSTRMGDGWLRMASYPAGTLRRDAMTQVLEKLGRLVRVESAVFADTPFRNYTVMQIADSSYGGISGLEHQNSHVDVTTPLAIGQPILMSIYAHEIFHAWNVKRLRPADLWPYQYAHEQPTPWLWVSEGITDYYADLAEVRSGIVDSVGFFQLTAGKMAEIANLRPVALNDASLSAWVHPVDGTDDSYYAKGSLAGFMLDIMIRDASDNRVSLDDVMRRLYREAYQQGKGFTPEQWWGAVSAAAGGRSFADFDARYVDGRDPYPWSTLLPLAGMRLTVDTARTPSLGLTTQLDSGDVVVTAVAPGSTGEQAGVVPGDNLLSIGDIPVTERGFPARFRDKFRTPGVTVPIAVRRGDRPLSLSGPLHFEERVEMRIDADPRASAKAARIRAGMLHGTVEKK